MLDYLKTQWNTAQRLPQIIETSTWDDIKVGEARKVSEDTIYASIRLMGHVLCLDHANFYSGDITSFIGGGGPNPVWNELTASISFLWNKESAEIESIELNECFVTSPITRQTNGFIKNIT
jgi:hypothetical protein